MAREYAPFATTKEQTLGAALDVVDAATLKAKQVSFGIVSVSGELNRSIQAATASTTQTLAGGTTITADRVIVTSANDYDAVTLPVVSTVTFHEVTLFNTSAKKCTVFPGETGTKIDGGTAAAAVTLTGSCQATFLQTDATNWISYGAGTITGAT